MAMATASDLRALEAETPWLRADFQADLAALGQSSAEAARRFAGDMRVLARLVAQVPRCPFDDRGATPWTSFRREVAVARSISDQAAAGEIRTAVRLTSCLGVTLRLLEHGRITVARARTLVDELTPYDDDLAGRLDAQLAEKVAGLPAWRIAQEVRRAAAVLDPEAAAVRTAAKNADRSVQLEPLPDDQALVLVQGPAVPLTRWYDTLDGRARALRQTGDPRTLAQLRFDLVSSTYPCATHSPLDNTADSTADSTAAAAEAQAAGAVIAEAVRVAAAETAESAEGPAAAAGPADPPAAAPAAPPSATPGSLPAGLRPNFVAPASTDCRMSRPVQASINVPVETALGLSNEPAWLDGYGWVSAPTARLLLVDAELRRVCTRSGTGELVGLADRDVRPAPTPDGVRQALLDMVTEPISLSDIGSRAEAEHDPSPPLRDFVALRDRFCDGPTGTRVPAHRCDLDHDTPHPHGPTAAWNLRARAQRTHQLKHYGWTPLRTPTSTLWFSPAGQVIETPTHTTAPPGVDDPEHARLPDPDELRELDQHQLTASEHGPRPWVPADERPRINQRVWLADDAEMPF